jgi:glycosyltransferase involved in cell wall biosynthesis
MAPRILIDYSPSLVRSAGVKTYLHHWIQALQQISPDAIRSCPSLPACLRHNGFSLPIGTKLAVLQLFNKSPQTIANLFATHFDVLHASNLLRRIPSRPALSATIHDCTSLLFPELHLPAQATADAAFAERVLRPARGLISVSESTRTDAIRLLKLNPDKITVIYPGVPETYRNVKPAALNLARLKYSLPPRFFLFTGTIEPRKNVDGLLNAWLSLPPDFRQEHSLILAGMSGWKASTTLRRLAQLSRENSGVRWLGYVPESLMPGLTAAALALVYPSLYEGFGFPLVQAMAAGCPVITSNISSMPEVTAGAALLTDPLSQAEIAAAMRQLAESSSLRNNLTAAGLERSQTFTWPKAAERSMEYFSKLAGQRR